MLFPHDYLTQSSVVGLTDLLTFNLLVELNIEFDKSPDLRFFFAFSSDGDLFSLSGGLNYVLVFDLWL